MLLKRKEIYFSMMNIKFESTEDMINELQQLKGKSKLKYHQKISNYYDEMKDMRQSNTFIIEDPFDEKAEGLGKIFHEAFLLLLKFLQTKPHVKSMKTNFYDLNFTVNKNLTEDGEN